ncbi:hypothetical protein LS70_003855 [Helicobacter sp. MIT 11-5569]|uniref:hypothetical protein n=1 Tax=Helicobacter sp. MIT 11-5569 TaxID=1548151 RepID=UPI00051F8B13|nr:hypothetical protein [Helicobacter sp. MIT 11-5569]TLD83953.1 hypothetical protein LS70_003855 [Helicobacter sp. MIT 11-5569]
MGKSSSKRDKYFEEKLAQLKEINEKNKLGLSDEELEISARWYADARVESEKKWYESGKFWSGLIFSLGAIAISSFMGGFAGWANLTNAIKSAVTIASAVLSVGTLTYGAYVYYAASRIAFKNQELSNQVSAKAALNDVREAKSAQITEFLIHNPKEIFPNGAVYNAGRAGDMDSFSPSIAYFGGKGLCGEFEINAVDEQIMNRLHYERSGNFGYMQDLTGAKEYNAVAGLSVTQLLNSSRGMLKKINERLQEGFSELIEAGWAQWHPNPQEVMEAAIEAQIAPYCKRIADIDFLDKLQNYRRAIQADFSFIREVDINPYRKKGQLSLFQYKAKYKEWEKQQASDLFSLDEKAQLYLQSIRLYIRALKTVVQSPRQYEKGVYKGLSQVVNNGAFYYHYYPFDEKCGYYIEFAIPTNAFGQPSPNDPLLSHPFYKSFRVEKTIINQYGAPIKQITYNKAALEYRLGIAAYQTKWQANANAFWAAKTFEQEARVYANSKEAFENFIQTTKAVYNSYTKLWVTTAYNGIPIPNFYFRVNEKRFDETFSSITYTTGGDQNLSSTSFSGTAHLSGYYEEKETDPEKQAKDKIPFKKTTTGYDFNVLFPNATSSVQNATTKTSTSSSQKNRKSLEEGFFSEIISATFWGERGDFNVSESDAMLIRRYEYLFKWRTLKSYKTHFGAVYEGKGMPPLKISREWWWVPLSQNATNILGKPLPMDKRLENYAWAKGNHDWF